MRVHFFDDERGVVSGFLANGATANHWKVALFGESQQRRQSDKVGGTFCGAGLHADTWLRLPQDVLTNGKTGNLEDSTCVRREPIDEEKIVSFQQSFQSLINASIFSHVNWSELFSLDFIPLDTILR